MRQKTLQLSEAVVGVLRRSMFTETTVVLPDEKLDRPLYEEVNKILDAAGGKWNRKAKAHLFPAGTDPRIVFSDALHSGTIVHEKQTRQAFYTPPEIARLAAKRAEITNRHRVMEPSCGAGALVDAIMEHRPAYIAVLDIDRPSIEALGKKLNEREDKDNSLISPTGVQTYCGDFLATDPPREGELFDRIVMNPPFTAGQEVDHVRHAFDFLRPGGRLVAIMSVAVQTRNDRRYADFREWLEDNTEDRAFERLPEDAFRESGTGVATVLFSCRYCPNVRR